MAKKISEAEALEQECLLHEGVINGLKEALRADARGHIAKGTVKLPVDPEEFAGRLCSNPLVSGAGLTRAEIVKAIEDVCDELDLERLKKAQKDDRGTTTP